MDNKTKAVRYITILVCAVLLAIATIHFYWAAGGHFAGKGAIPTVNGKRLLNPSPIGTVLVAICFIAMSICVAITGRLVPLAGLYRLSYYGTWGIAAIFLLRAVGDFHLVGFFKTIAGTRFAENDTLIYSPLSLIMSIAVCFIAIKRYK